MIGEGVISKYTGIPGWSTEAESTALVELAQKYVPVKDGVIVELGGEYAKSASDFAYAAREKQGTKIVTVDLFPDDHHLAKQYGGLFNVWQRNLTEAGVIGNNVSITPARGVSWEVGEKWQEPIDLLFIDAGHTFEEVNRDISAWLHHVKPGGIVVFHDYAKDENAHPLHHEVKRAVDGYFNHHGIKSGYWKTIELPDSLIAFEMVGEPINIYDEQPTMESRASTDKTAKKTGKPTKAKPVTKAGKRTNKSAKK